MSKKIEATPNPKSTDYKLKDQLITQLGSGDDAVMNISLLELGAALVANPLLSNKQQADLIAKLRKSSLLTYQANYFAAIDLAENENRFAEIEPMKAGLDLVSWDIDADGKLQAKTIIAVAQLQKQLGSPEQIRTISDLLNAGHLATHKDSVFSAPYEDNRYQYSDATVSAIEAAVFEQRLPYAMELVELGLVLPEETDDLNELDLEAFKSLRDYTELYDYLIVLHFLKTLTTKDAVGRFIELQAVTYFGFAIGIRDAKAAYMRFQGEDE